MNKVRPRKKLEIKRTMVRVLAAKDLTHVVAGYVPPSGKTNQCSDGCDKIFM